MKVLNHRKLSAASIKPEDHFREWCSVMGRDASVRSLSRDRWELLSDIEIWQLPSAEVVAGHMSGFEYRRARGNAQKKTSAVSLVICLAGEITLIYNNEVVARAGERTIVLGSAEVELTVITESPTRSVTLHLHDPAILSAAAITEALPVIEIGMTQGIWQTMTLMAEQLLTVLRRSDAVGIAALFKGIETVTNELAKPLYLSRAQVDDDRIVAIAAFVDEHTRNPDLGVDMLCERFHMSRATLYRHMQHLGGVKRYLQARRLTHCFDDLRKSSKHDPSFLRALVRSYQFRSFSDFTTRYQQHFGVDPMRLMNARSLEDPLLQERGIDPIFRI